MDYHEVSIALKKQIRRRVMHAFNIAHIDGEFSASMTVESLCGLFMEVDRRYLRSDVRYLVDKGYVRRTNARPNQPFDEWEFELTATGKEQCDRILRDPALEP